jgi:nitroreductase
VGAYKNTKSPITFKNNFSLKINEVKMDFLNLAKKRKTVYEFTEKNIKDSDLNKILEAGRWAPSCSNFQPWNFIVIRKKETIEGIMKKASYGVFHTIPSLIIMPIVTEEFCEGESLCVKNKKLGLLESQICLTTATMSMVLEATDLGIGSALITPDQKSLKKLMKLKEGDLVPAFIALGYEKKGAFQKKRTRKELKEIVSYEYRNGVKKK